MTDLLRPTRRGFLTAAIGLVVAPAIVRASSLMPIKALVEPLTIDPAVQQFLITGVSGNSMLTIDMVTKEAVRLWRNADQSMLSLFPGGGLKIGDTITMRLK